MSESLNESLQQILTRYQRTLSSKIYAEENNTVDVLMDVFGVTPTMKRENRQYWGRELGMCWQLLVTRVFNATRQDVSPAIRIGSDEPCDFVFENYAVDTKYRIGSGASGTLKKFRNYGQTLKALGHMPTLLILRDDNLLAAIAAFQVGGWDVYIGEQTFNFVLTHTAYDLKDFLLQNAGQYRIER